MNKNILLSLAVFSGIFMISSFSGCSKAEMNVPPSVDRKEDLKADLPIVLRKCTSEEIGMTFDCDPTWKLNRKDKTLKVTISESPRVEMFVEENDQTIRFLSEMNESAFDSMGRYEPGFHFEHLTQCNRETIKINGYLKGHPETRVSDFYLIDQMHMHSVKFTVDPKEAWENYKWLIKDIVDSLHIIQQKSDIKFYTEETDEVCEDLVK